MSSYTGDAKMARPTTDGPSEYSRHNPRPAVTLWHCSECGDMMNTKDAYITHMEGKHPHLLAKT